MRRHRRGRQDRHDVHVRLLQQGVVSAAAGAAGRPDDGVGRDGGGSGRDRDVAGEADGLGRDGHGQREQKRSRCQREVEEAPRQGPRPAPSSEIGLGRLVVDVVVSAVLRPSADSESPSGPTTAAPAEVQKSV